MPTYPRPNVVVSRCLGVANCRYNGQAIPDDLVSKLEPFVEFTTVCPEVQIGLGVPRNPVRIVSIGDDLRLMQPATMSDVTDLMRDFTNQFLESLGQDVDGFILKNRSPSCGLSDVKVYPQVEKSKALHKGMGFFGGEVKARFPGLAIEDEGRLKNQEIRQHFLTRLFTLARFREMKALGSMRALVQFQAEHKYLLMAYNQEEMRALGRIVANHEKLDTPQVLAAYEEHLRAALAHPPHCGAHINALMHTIGYLKRQLAPEEKAYFSEQLERYRAARIPLSVPVNMMYAYGLRFGEDYVLQQAYFAPYPDDLVEVTTTGKVPTCFRSPRG